MSEAEVPEAGPVSVDDVLQAIQQKNLARAKAHFNDLMGYKVNDALENEKVRMASQVYNAAPEEEEVEEPEEVETDVEDTEKEVELSLEDEEVDLDAEVEAAFEEETAEEQ